MPPRKTMKDKLLRVIFTKRRLSKEELEVSGNKEYDYLYNGSQNIEVGDLLNSPNYNTSMQVVGVYTEFALDSDINYKHIIIDSVEKYNKQEPKEMKKNTMVQGMIDKMKSQFIPQKEEGVKLSMDGALCVQVNDEYVGINKEGTLVSYPAEMCIDAPVYSIAKPTKDIKEGDIIKRKNSFAKVLNVNKDGSLRCLTYSGYVSNKKEIQDFVLNQSVERVLINMFNFDNNLGFNPMIFALMDDNEGLDIKGLMMMQMMQNQNGGNANMFGGMNPMMLMMLSKDGDSSSMSDMILMSMCMGNTNPFAAR